MPRNFYAHCAQEPRRRDDVPHGWHRFPLTPALSLGERENSRQSQSQPMVPVDGRFMGSCLFRWELLTDHESRPERARLGHCNVRCRGKVGKFRSSHPAGRCCARGRAHSGAIARHVTTPVIHGSWAVACSDGNCSRIMNRGRSVPVSGTATSAAGGRLVSSDRPTPPGVAAPGDRRGAGPGQSQTQHHACHLWFMERGNRRQSQSCPTIPRVGRSKARAMGAD